MPSYTDFFQCVKNSVRATATKLKTKPQDWFAFCKNQIQHVLDRMNKLFDEYRKAFGAEADILCLQVKLASKLRDIAVKDGKTTYPIKQTK